MEGEEKCTIGISREGEESAQLGVAGKDTLQLRIGWKYSVECRVWMTWEQAASGTGRERLGESRCLQITRRSCSPWTGQ